MSDTEKPASPTASRRDLLVGTAALAAAVPMMAATSTAAEAASPGKAKTNNMVTTKDGTQIFVKDWGTGQPFVFSHGWPLSSDAWADQMMHVASNGFRAVAHDRRGHGRSSQPWDGNTMDQYADDLAEVIEALDLKDIILVGHSTGGGEVTRYIGRHGTKRVAKLVLIGAVTPTMAKSDRYPTALPMSVFDGIRTGVMADRSQFYKDLTIPFFGANREGAKVSDGTRDEFWREGMMGGLKGQYDCIKAFSESDFTADLKGCDVPVLIIHGDDDQIVPIDISARVAATIAPKATLSVYAGGDHGLAVTHKDRLNSDLVAFAKS